MGIADYSFHVVWQRAGHAYEEAVLDLWDEFELFGTREVARTKLEDVVYVMVNTAGKVVAISSAKKTFIKRLQLPMYLWRCFVHPDHRGLGVNDKLCTMTRDYLEEVHISDGEPECKGLFTEVQNPNVNSTYRKAVWPMLDMVYIGQAANGNQYRVYYFRGAKV